MISDEMARPRYAMPLPASRPHTHTHTHAYTTFFRFYRAGVLEHASAIRDNIHTHT